MCRHVATVDVSPNPGEPGDVMTPRVAFVLFLLLATAVLAEPVSYTHETKTGLTSRNTERNLYESVWEFVRPYVKGLSSEEQECGKMTAAQAFLEATRKATEGSLFNPLDGLTEAQRFFRDGQDEWCNRQGGQKGADAVAPHLSRAQSVVRPFLREKLEEMQKAQGRPLTPGEVAAIIGAGLLALPALIAAGT
jgi:hypothetical protein